VQITTACSAGAAVISGDAIKHQACELLLVSFVFSLLMVSPVIQFQQGGKLPLRESCGLHPETQDNPRFTV
jgi:hypothetical protein